MRASREGGLFCLGVNEEYARLENRFSYCAVQRYCALGK